MVATTISQASRSSDVWIRRCRTEVTNPARIAQPVPPEEHQQGSGGGDVQADDERQVGRLRCGNVQVLCPLAAQQRRHQHRVPEAGDREQLGDALGSADDHGFDVAQVRAHRGSVTDPEFHPNRLGLLGIWLPNEYGGQMAARLLDTVRVLDLSGGVTDTVTRLLADLGADVLKVEPPGGSPGRDDLPTLAGASIPFAVHNANKRSAVLNPHGENDRRRFFDLVEGTDIVVDSGLGGQAAAFGTSCAELADRYPHLVALSITDFGATGPRSSWCATDPVLFAMSGSLSRSGPATGTPVLPPDGIASATAAVQAAWAALVAYYNRLRCGTGDYIDFSRFDAVVMALDPAFGAHGQAAAGRPAPGSGGAARRTRTLIRSFRARTATSGCA